MCVRAFRFTFVYSLCMSNEYEFHTDEELNELAAEYKAALKVCAVGQSYKVAGREYTYQSIDKIRSLLRSIAVELSTRRGCVSPPFVSIPVRFNS